MTLEPGLRVGGYTLREPIGEGGMGVVWRARDTALDRDVAIKFLPAEFARDPARLLRFEREAKAVAALSHPGILAIYGFGEHDGTAYAVTELLEGETLRRALGAGPLTPERAADVARQVARGLAAAHDRGIVHRDLKPENVFLTRDGHVKILDFGLASQFAAGDGEPSDASRTPTRTHLTAPGVIVGTTDYLSPEQVRGRPADPRSDIFTFGTVLFEMLAGWRPFQRNSAPETMTAILREEAPAATGAPPALAAVVARCLRKDPGARFATGRELAAALDTASGAAAVAAGAGSGAAHAHAHGAARRPGRAPLVIAAVAVVAVAAGIVYWRVSAPIGVEVPGGPGARIGVTSIGDRPSANVEANEYFEQGLLFMRTQMDLPRARKAFDQAIALDPSFGSPRVMSALLNVIEIEAGIANDVTRIYESDRELREVLAHDPGLASAHGALGAVQIYLNRKQQARDSLQKALQLNPDIQTAIAWRTIELRLSGRTAEAEASARAALERMSLFWIMRVLLASALLEEGRLDEARRELEKVLDQDPANLRAGYEMARLRVHQGDRAGARAILEAVPAAEQGNYRVRIVRALLLAREGKPAEAIAVLDDATLSYAGIALFAQADVADVYALAGRTEDALDWLDRAVRSGDERSDWFRRDELLAGIRGEARFRMILDAIDRGKK